MRRWSPPPALGPVPEEITDPFTVMLWGITTERLEEWLSSEDGGIEPPDRDHGLTRTRRGPCARDPRLHGAGTLLEGEILVAPTTSTSWTPVFGTIAGAVLTSAG